MKKEEFKKLYPIDKEKHGITEIKEGNKVTIYVETNSIYNKAIEQYRASINTWPADYAADFCSAVRKISNEDLLKCSNPENDEILNKLKQNELTRVLIEKNVPFKLDFFVESSNVNVYGEPHHFTPCIKLQFDIEYIYIYYDYKSKRKVFLFFDDGVLVLKYPPYNLKGDPFPTGVFPYTNELKIYTYQF